MPQMPDDSSDDPRSKRGTLSGHLWWILEVIAIVACLVLWLVMRDGMALVYALGSVALLALVFHLSQHANRRSDRTSRR